MVVSALQALGESEQPEKRVRLASLRVATFTHGRIARKLVVSTPVFD